MESEIIFLVNESPEGGYEAKALSYSIFTEADTLDELCTMVKDAVECHFDDQARPSIFRNQTRCCT
jgi:hypothetical protein